MNILFLGDIVGRSGREAALAAIPDLKKSLRLDLLVINGENAAGGFGITEQIAKDFYEVGVDVITTGNHVWDQRTILQTIDQDPCLLRPINFPAGTPGKGMISATLKTGGRIVVINVMARLFMDPLDDPFRAVDAALKGYVLGKNVDAILVDVHGEASSEKMAMGHYLDGRVSLVVGTHTHIPTADAMILPKGTGYQTDAGMCGDYNSVIGMKASSSVHRFVKKVPGERMEPANGEATLCGVFIQTDKVTGITTRIEPLRQGPGLINTLPTV